MADPVAILVAARDEQDRIRETIAALRHAFPETPVVVADDGSHDGTAERAESAGAAVLRLPRRGKGQALTLAERAVPPGRLLLCDADLAGDLRPLLRSSADVAVAAFAERQGGGFGIARKAAARAIRARAGRGVREPLSGQRALSPAARAACFPLGPGFGCETLLTIEAVRAGLSVEEVELELSHRTTGRDLRGFVHRGRQLLDIALALGPLAVNHRGLRLPLVGWAVALGGIGARRRTAGAIAAVAAIGLADDLWSGPERGWRAHLHARRTTGVLKLAGVPLAGLAATGSASGAVLVALSANGLNLLDTRPGRALKAFLAGALTLRGDALPYAGLAVLLAPYDLREMAMLGDAGSNALGAVLGLRSVERLTGRGRLAALGALLALTALGEARSIGALIERTPGLSALDRLGRQP